MIKRIVILLLVVMVVGGATAFAQQGRLVVWSATTAELTEALIQRSTSTTPTSASI